MPSWKTSRPRHFSSYAGYFLVAWGFSCAAVPLFAQSMDTADSTTPAAPSPPNATPAQTPVPPKTSAATTATDSAFSTETSPVSSAAGPAPVSGPGAVLTPVLGDHLGSAYTSDRLPFRVTAALGEIYDDNIFAQPSAHKSFDYITRLSVQGELQLGNVLSVDGNYLDAFYNPVLHLYVRHPHENGVDQDVDVLYAHHFSRLTLSLEQVYSSIQSTNAAVGGLVTTEVFNTQAMAKLAYSMKLDLVATFTQNFTSYDVPSYTDSKQWVGEFYSLYHLDDRLSFGLGPRIGYLILKDAPDEHFQQFLARVIYAPNDKLTVQAAAGGEDREYQTPARSDSLEPIFEFRGVYLPLASTTVILNAARRFTPSYNFIGEDYLATNVNLDATQRFFRNYYISLKAGYENDDYQGVGAHVAGPAREDNYFYLQPSLSWKPNAGLGVALFDKYEEDDSNTAIFAYDANQLGVTVSATY